MKHKIWFLIGVFSLAACGVELKDKAKETEPVQVVMTSAQPDYVIDGPVVLNAHESIEVDRLVLTKNAVIITEDKNLVIQVKE